MYNDESEWSYWSDTSVTILVNTIALAPVRCFSVYWSNFASALNLTRLQFSYIIIAMYLGAILTGPIAPFNLKILKKSKNIQIVYGFANAILIILFMIISYIPNTTISWSFEIICCIFYGIAFNIVQSNAPHLATFYTANPEVCDKILALMDMGWQLSTLIFVAVGYALDDEQYGYVIVLSLIGGFLVLLVCVQWYLWRNKFNIDESANNQLNNEEFEDVNSNGNGWQIYLFKWQLLETLLFYISLGIILNVMPGLWFEDLYGFSSSNVGLFTLAIFVVGFSATILVHVSINYLGVWFWTIFNLTTGISVMFVLLLLDHFLSEKIPIWIAGIAVCLLWSLDVLQIICDLIVIVKRANANNISPHFMISVYFSLIFSGFMISVLIVAHIWDYGNGLGDCLLISFFLLVGCSMLWIQIYRNCSNIFNEDYIRISDTEITDQVKVETDA